MVQGLLEQETSGPGPPQAPQQATPQQPTPPMPQQPGGPQQQAPGQEADAIDKFIANGMKMIHDSKISDSFIKKIVKAEDPAVEIADAVSMVVKRLGMAAQKSGLQLQPNGIAQATNILMGEIIRVAEAGGLEGLSPEDKYRAFSTSVSKNLASAVDSGAISPEQLQQISEQIQQSPEGQQMAAGAGKMGGGPQQGAAPQPMPGMQQPGGGM